jgi:hypothetical protein
MDGLAPGGAFAVGGFVREQAEEMFQDLSGELKKSDPEKIKDRWMCKPMAVPTASAGLRR